MYSDTKNNGGKVFSMKSLAVLESFSENSYWPKLKYS